MACGVNRPFRGVTDRWGKNAFSSIFDGVHFGGWRSQNLAKHPPVGGFSREDGMGRDSHRPQGWSKQRTPRGGWRMASATVFHPEAPWPPLSSPLLCGPWRFSRSVRDDDMHTLLVCVVSCRCVWVPPFGGLLWGLVDHGSPGHSRASDHNPVFGAATALSLIHI